MCQRIICKRTVTTVWSTSFKNIKLGLRIKDLVNCTFFPQQFLKVMLLLNHTKQNVLTMKIYRSSFKEKITRLPTKMFYILQKNKTHTVIPSQRSLPRSSVADPYAFSAQMLTLYFLLSLLFFSQMCHHIVVWYLKATYVRRANLRNLESM